MSKQTKIAASQSPSPASRACERRGSVLVAVLAIVLLLSFIVTRFIEEAVEDLEYLSIFNEPSDVRSFTYSMLEVALATVNEVALIDEGKLYAPEQGWVDPIYYAGIEIPHGWEVQVHIQDESGKLPINTMDEAALNQMLEESFDFEFGTARELSSMLLDWIDPDEIRRLNGAESEDYLRRNPPYRAANSPLQSLNELRLIEIWEKEFFDQEGRPNDRFTQLENMVSVINSGTVNLNTSTEPVLELLALQNGFDEDRIFDGLQDLPYLMTTPGSTNAQNCSVEVQLLRVTVSVLRGRVPFTVSALIEPISGKESTSSSNTPGRSSADAPKTGVGSEQEAIKYPFNILQVSEYSKGQPNSPSARYSALDISGKNN